MSKTHLYNSKTGKVRWFVERFGARELLMKPFRSVFAPLIMANLRPRTFQFKEAQLDLLYHPYNMTWITERSVEVPVARYFTARFPPEKTLEVGNVLSHYSAVKHDVLDKFEKAPGVINEDIITFQPPKRYELIISISTFEHIGFDDESNGRSAEKILEAIKVCRALLSPGGLLLLTVPMGYNPELNSLIQAGRLGATKETFLGRTGPQEWRECDRNEALKRRYKEPFPYANAILVAEFSAAAQS